MPKPKLKDGGDFQNYILLSKKIKPQFPETPSGRLAHAVIHQALKDSVSGNVSGIEKADAKKYLRRNPIPHAETAGVDTYWIRSVAEKIGFQL